ncbi:polysaccharide biosynthesis/export family protein [Piscinibacter sakaiensis]|uniref:polysaccharide biosynthesis/export family protein n=1 Tax=Piscinibacter sakaiensis TaxID=1547922 RepID=UPI00372C666F
MNAQAASLRAVTRALAAALCLALGACAGLRSDPSTPRGSATSIPVLTPAAAARAAGTAEPPGYTFSAGDEFDLRVPDAPQFDQTLRVRPDGKVSLPVIGAVQALGRTPEAVEAELRERFQKASGAGVEGQYFLQPNDELELKFPYHSNLNEVVKLRPDGKLQLQLIGTVQASGLTPEGLRELLLGRYERVLRRPELAVVLRTATTQNVRLPGGAIGRAGLAGLQPTVIVRSSQPQQVFVGGEVVRPGVLAWRPGLTVIQAVAESGWYLPSAEISRLMVLRRTDDNRSQVLRPDFGYDLNGEQKADLLLQPFDIVLLPRNSASRLADALNQYVFNLLPPLRNSSLGFSYVLRDPTP